MANTDESHVDSHRQMTKDELRSLLFPLALVLNRTAQQGHLVAYYDSEQFTVALDRVVTENMRALVNYLADHRRAKTFLEQLAINREALVEMLTTICPPYATAIQASLSPSIVLGRYPSFTYGVIGLNSYEAIPAKDVQRTVDYHVGFGAQPKPEQGIISFYSKRQFRLVHLVPLPPTGQPTPVSL